MSSFKSQVDPGGFLEFSVVFSDRSLNSMSPRFCQVMRDLSAQLKSIYQAEEVAIIPGGGTFGMEAIARQFAQDEHVLVIRNGWFSYRWSQIIERGCIARHSTVCKAMRVTEGSQSPFVPQPLPRLLDRIRSEQPAIVFCPHVETSAGVIMPTEWIKSLTECVHEYGGLFVLDCIASGAMLTPMRETGVDVLLSAPQKGWSSTPCAALVMLSERAIQRLDERESVSFSLDLKKWLDVMRSYTKGGHAYHATMPTDGLLKLRDTLDEMGSVGFAKLQDAQQQLGDRIRSLLKQYGFPSVAGPGFEAPSVVVSYTTDPDIKSGARWIERGIQIAAGVPLQCGEGSEFSTFRIGLFGLDKLLNIDETVARFERALKEI